MRRLLANLILVISAIVFGYWLKASNAIEETPIGDGLEWAVEKVEELRGSRDETDVQVPSDSSDETKVSKNKKSSEESKQDTISENEEQLEKADNHKPAEVDYQKVEAKIFDLLNQLRKEKNVQQVTKNKQLKKAADIRAKESAETFSHTRPNGKDAFTVFDEKGLDYPYQMAGENLAMGTYYMKEEEMAEFLFNGWVDSPGHYKNMVQKDFSEVGIGVYYDGNNLYATQLFGTPRK